MTEDLPRIQISKCPAQYKTFIFSLTQEARDWQSFQDFFATQCECKRAGGELGFYAIRHTRDGDVYVVISLPLDKRNNAEFPRTIVRGMLAETIDCLDLGIDIEPMIASTRT